MQQTFQFIQSELVPLGAIGVFAAAFLEETVLPLPSAAVMMAAGLFFLTGDFSLTLARDLVLIVVIPITLGATLGSVLIYYLAYWSGKPAFMRWGKYMGVTWRELESVEKKFQSGHNEKLILFGLRAVPIFPSTAIDAICGLIRLNFRNFTVLTLAGTLVRATLLALLGWQLGSVYGNYVNLFEYAQGAIVILVAVPLILYIFMRIRGKRKRKKAAP
jgi:membrane protein DedA with SNARE-associated domain